MKRSMVLMSMAALLLAGTVSAAVKQGQMEVEALGGWTQLSGANGMDDLKVTLLSGSVGYFVTNNIEVSGVGMGAWISGTPLGIGDVSVYAVGGSGKYHFMPDKQWVPYVGGQILWGQADVGAFGTKNATIYGALGGVRYEVTPVTDLFIEGQYNWTNGDLKDAYDNIFIVTAGFVHKWK